MFCCRWDRTAYDNALSFGFDKIAEKIKAAMDKVSGGFVPMLVIKIAFFNLH